MLICQRCGTTMMTQDRGVIGYNAEKLIYNCKDHSCLNCDCRVLERENTPIISGDPNYTDMMNNYSRAGIIFGEY